MTTHSNPITDHLVLWTSALLNKSTAGRGSNGKQEAYGIKKLRELILELAVRGKLVPQDPNDEPAASLLKKIAAEKIRLTKEGKLTKQKPLPKIVEDELYFTLPNGWSWLRLGEITNYGIADKAEPSDVKEDTWVLDLEDVEKNTSRLLQKVCYSEKPFQSSKNRFSKGDVIYGKLRPYLDKVIVADEDGVCTTEMIPIRGYHGLYPFYLRMVMKTPYFIKYADDSTHGMNLPRLGTDKARMAIFPLAPYNEQHRIVAKVDELMALCDQLEQQQTNSIAAHQTLVQNLLDTLIARDGVYAGNAGAISGNPQTEEFEQAWNRIADCFDTLFTTELSIDQLKQTLLQLAVMGKLVPQDPNEEPASVLLELVEAEKVRLIENGKIKNRERLPEITDDEKPFVIMDGWEWSRFGDLWLDSFYGPRFGKEEYVAHGGYPTIRTTDMTADGKISLKDPPEVLVDESKLPLYELEKGDLLITRSGSIGTMAIFDLDIVAIPSAYLIRVRLSKSMVPEYALLMLMSPLGQSYLGLNTTSVGVPNVNATKMAQFVFAIPPEAEQLRIVAKVNELMTLCDALKASIAAAQTTQLQLADAIVEQAVA